MPGFIPVNNGHGNDWPPNIPDVKGLSRGQMVDLLKSGGTYLPPLPRPHRAHDWKRWVFFPPAYPWEDGYTQTPEEIAAAARELPPLSPLPPAQESGFKPEQPPIWRRPPFPHDWRIKGDPSKWPPKNWEIFAEFEGLPWRQ